MYTPADDSRVHRLDSAEFVFEAADLSAEKRSGCLNFPVQIAVQGSVGESARHPALVFAGRMVTGAYMVQRFNFGCCPICFNKDDLTDEHVPMQKLGGSAMTKTCKSCNNDLAPVEEELRKVFDAEVAVSAAANDGGAVRGYRGATAVLRDALGRDPIVLVTSAHPEFAGVVTREGSVDVTYGLHDPFLAAAGLLKYSYLAACLWLQEVPRSKSADEVRALLLAIRDGRMDDARVQARIVGRVWPFVRIENADRVSTIALLEPSGAQPYWMFVFAGRLAIRWPLTDIHPDDRM